MDRLTIALFVICVLPSAAYFVIARRLARRLEKLKRLGLAPASTPTNLYATGATFWLLSGEPLRIADPLVLRLTRQARWCIVCSLAAVVVWAAWILGR